MKKEIKAGVIGLGRIGKLHVHNIMAQIGEVKLVGVSDVLEESLKDTAETY